MEYTKTEIGIPVLLITLPWIIGTLAALTFGDPDLLFKYLFGGVSIVQLIILVSLYAMTITVDDRQVAWKFGIGTWQGHIPLEKINKVEVVDIKSWGLGVRVVGGGTLYTVSGNKAVRLHVQTPWTKDKIIELGTPEPEVLKEFIERKAGLTVPESDQLPAAEKDIRIDDIPSDSGTPLHVKNIKVRE